ncbi:hypothetical protein SQ03_14530 [Methylobacterium platani JCM 14648]|uniref:Mobile element protein n=1 Tax=Methylobacterium platani JCM 14648 TaxID=1295136 RepID=A0ABR5H0X7_9HYPH|nr:hypothetical protein SQ03_14530 [Methylobacterium platani JCM 14648]
MSGVEVVTIPLAHYAELLDCQRRLAVASIPAARYTADPRSRVERDPEVATFLAECLGVRLLKDTHAQCLRRFGADRTPGKSTIQRYWTRLGR